MKANQSKASGEVPRNEIPGRAIILASVNVLVANCFRRQSVTFAKICVYVTEDSGAQLSTSFLAVDNKKKKMDNWWQRTQADKKGL